MGNIMHTTLPLSLKPERILFLSRSESSVRMDLMALRGLGVRHCMHESDSTRAIRLLRDGRPQRKKNSGAGSGRAGNVDLVVCDERLADVPAFALLTELSKNPELGARPVLLIASSSASASAFRALGVTVLQRPYTPTELARMMQKAMSPTHRGLDPAAFAKAARAKDFGVPCSPKTTPKKTAPVLMTTSDWYRQGVEAFEAGSPQTAGKAFARVLRRQEDHVGAALGLARICRADGDSKGMRGWLVRAAAASLRQADKAGADIIAAMLPEHMRRNIFVYEAAGHMEQGAYRPAALSFMDAGTERPEIPMHRQIARICLLTPKPEESIRRLCGAFDGLGHVTTAAFLRHRLLDYVPYEGHGNPSWLDKYPRLKEAADVALHTAHAWNGVAAR